MKTKNQTGLKYFEPKINLTTTHIFTGLELLKTAIEKAGYTGKIQIGMDVAASGMINHR